MVSDAAIGFICCTIATLTFGSNFACTKKSPVGDGMFVQWMMASAIFVVGLIAQVSLSFPKFYALPLLSGFLWVTGNLMCIPIINAIGMGLGILIWSSSNMLFGWASGRFGWFGLKPEVPESLLLNYLGVAISMLGTIAFFFVKSSGLSPDAEVYISNPNYADVESVPVLQNDEPDETDSSSPKPGRRSTSNDESAPEADQEVDEDAEEAKRWNLSKEDYINYKESFNQFDRDGDGTVTTEELGEVIRICGFKPSDKWVKDLLKEADKDGSGTIELPEFLTCMTGKEPLPRATPAHEENNAGVQNAPLPPNSPPSYEDSMADKAHSITLFRTRFAIPSRIANNRPTPATMKKIIAMLASLVSGTFFGLQFAPIVYIQDNYEGASKRGEDYFFSLSAGIYACSTIYFLIYAAVRCNRPYLSASLILPGFSNGAIWAVGMVCWLVANVKLSEAITFPIISRMPGVVAALWGVFVFKEVEGRRNYVILVVAIVITTVGAVITGLSKTIKFP